MGYVFVVKVHPVSVSHLPFYDLDPFIEVLASFSHSKEFLVCCFMIGVSFLVILPNVILIPGDS